MERIGELLCSDPQGLERFLNRKSDYTLELFYHFIHEFQKIAPITIHPGKTMIGVANPRRKMVYISQLGRNFIHVVFLFKQAWHDNLCFQKIVPMPGDNTRMTHHFRMLHIDDVNEEVLKFMKMAWES